MLSSVQKTVVAAVAIGFGLLSMADSANAAFQLRVFSNNVQVGSTITDDGAGDGLNTIQGVLLATVLSPNFSVNVNTASSKPASGSAAHPFFSLSFSVTKIMGAAEVVRIEVTDTDFTPLVAAGLSAHVGGTLQADTSAEYDAYTASTNTEFDTTDANGSTAALGPFTTSSFSGSALLSNPLSAPYSLTQVITLNLKATSPGFGYEVSGNADIRAVPAPSALLLMLAGLPVVGLEAFRRRRTTVTA